MKRRIEGLEALAARDKAEVVEAPKKK